MKALLSQLSERERLLLFSAGPLLVLLLLYALVWRPFDQRVERLHEQVAEQQSLLQWMQISAQQVGQLRNQSGSRNISKQSLLPLVDRTIRQSGLSQALKRVEPDGDGKVKVRLEKAGFDAMIKWLETLQNRHAVLVENVAIDRQDGGVVNVRLDLVGGAA